MKDIKTFLIGFLTCACLFLIMGQTGGKGKNEFDSLKINKAIFLQDGDNQLVITPKSIGILSKNKQLILRKEGDHRLSSDADLKILTKAIDQVISLANL